MHNMVKTQTGSLKQLQGSTQSDCLSTIYDHASPFEVEQTKSLEILVVLHDSQPVVQQFCMYRGAEEAVGAALSAEGLLRL